MSLPSLDLDYLRSTLTRLLNTPSPVGFTERGADLCVQLLCEFDFPVEVGRKGVVTGQIVGKDDSAPRAITAHIDTLGAVVKTIKSNGRLQLSKLGNYSWNSLENQAVTLFTDDGAEFRGVVQIANASHHLYASGGNAEVPRDAAHMELRLDAPAQSGEELQKLGVSVGDVVAFDSSPQWNYGYIRARFLDDKALVACLLTALKALHDAKLKPAQNTTIHIPNYEEVGHGGATGISSEVHELLALDVAPVGGEQNSREHACTLCARDADGPYDHKMRRRLKRLAGEFNIDLRVDTFPEYCSDGDALWKSGADARVALIGPGVDATHGVERTHVDGLIATTNLIVAYLLDEAPE